MARKELEGLGGVPIIGITKSVHRSVIGAHYGEKDVLDYVIIRELAGNDKYFYIGPFRQSFGARKKLKILQYFLFLEHSVSPLRVEILEGSLPSGVEPDLVIKDVLRSLAIDNSGLHTQNGEIFKLPEGITEADQQVRETVKRKREELLEVMQKIQVKLAPDCHVR